MLYVISKMENDTHSSNLEAPLLVIQIRIRIPHSHSLKEKRKVVKSLKERLRLRFNVTVAEIGDLEKWQTVTLALAMFSNDRIYLDEQQSKMRLFIQEKLIGEGELIEFNWEII